MLLPHHPTAWGGPIKQWERRCSHPPGSSLQHQSRMGMEVGLGAGIRALSFLPCLRAQFKEPCMHMSLQEKGLTIGAGQTPVQKYWKKLISMILASVNAC
jgi:hypothetical protein